VGIRRDHPRRRIKMKFCMVGGIQKVVLRFEFHGIDQAVSELWGRNLPFLIDLAIGLYKTVISQQFKEVIANRHEKLNKLMIAQTP